MSNIHHDFLNPLLSVQTLDIYLMRQSILKALEQQLSNFEGTILDVGSGDMPYKSLLLMPPSRAKKYIALDINNGTYQKPDMLWDGMIMPLEDNSVESTLATEVLEHCPEPERLLQEVRRVLKPGGFFFFTVPFLWPLHCVPDDEYRYTPFSLQRHLENVGFKQITLQAHGGWDMSLAQMIGLWVRRRPMSDRKQKLLSFISLPIMRYLISHDQAPQEFRDRTMMTGFSGTARK